MKTSPFEAQPPAGRRLLRSVVLALAGALLILVMFVLPAEYSVDPTGVGGWLGLTAMNKPAVVEPIPLLNPEVFQGKSSPPRSGSKQIHLQPGEFTEIKVKLDVGQVVLFAWQVAGGEVYTDFHGHEPGAGDDAFVRYEEQQSGARGNGSLVAPFTGEHGWYWLNISEGPIDVVLNVSGYYSDLVDYGVSSQ